jgi:3,4-dehydroadipyl-CoA semialdehyde dehydrogenase
MGSLVGSTQRASVEQGLAELRGACDTLFDGSTVSLVDVDPKIAACVAPYLLGTRDADHNPLVHELEVFGPVATLLAYRDTEHALELARRGQGSLVASLYSADPQYLADTALELADSHGRVHAISPDVAKTQTGHGNVMPQSLHGGPGRAGGGEELGGLRALGLYQRRAAIQGSPDVVAALVARHGSTAHG